MKKKIIIRNKNHLMKALYDEIQANGNQCDLNHFDTSNVTSMNSVFYFNNEFNGDISKWDVSNVTDMSRMFEGSKFNGDISEWNVSNVVNMTSMFYRSKFDGDINDWEPYSLEYFLHIFDRKANTPYWSQIDNKHRREIVIETNHLRKLIKKEIQINGNNCDLNHIDVSEYRSMSHLFDGIEFNGDISQWDVSKVEDMAFIFNNSTFKGDLSNWKPYSLKRIDNIFINCSVVPPYWAECDDENQLKKSIDTYCFNQDLGQELSSANNKAVRKIKI
jgi:surface protein